MKKFLSYFICFVIFGNLFSCKKEKDQYLTRIQMIRLLNKYSEIRNSPFAMILGKNCPRRFEDVKKSDICMLENFFFLDAIYYCSYPPGNFCPNRFCSMKTFKKAFNVAFGISLSGRNNDSKVPIKWAKSLIIRTSLNLGKARLKKIAYRKYTQIKREQKKLDINFHNEVKKLSKKFTQE